MNPIPQLTKRPGKRRVTVLIRLIYRGNASQPLCLLP